jgi:hypothetical protein
MWNNHNIPKQPPQEVLDYYKLTFDYDPQTGIFKNKKTGNVVGSIGYKGYVRLDHTANGKLYRIKGHHLAWFLFHGEYPTSQIDHKNGQRDQNQIDNLRQATPSENCRNSKRSNGFTSTYGVSFDIAKGKYRARIWYPKTKEYKHLGYFDTEAEAAAAVQRHFEENLSLSATQT